MLVMLGFRVVLEDFSEYLRKGEEVGFEREVGRGVGSFLRIGLIVVFLRT